MASRDSRRGSIRDRFVRLKERWRARRAPERVGDGPYRSGPAAPKEVRRKRWTYAFVGLILGAPLLLMVFAKPDEEPLEAATLEVLPPVLLSNVAVFPPVEPELQSATPLAPLLAADGPERLALTQPGLGATRLQHHQPLHLVFNRPMVDATEVGEIVPNPPISLRLRSGGTVRGTARWSSRSRLIFHADASTWNGVQEATLHVSPSLQAADGDVLGEQTERVVVFDGTPHLLASGGQRVGSGAPLPLYFDNHVGAGELNGDVLAYEIGGGARAVPFHIVNRGWEQSRYRLDLIPGRTLEPGAQIGVALSPRWTRWAGATPAVARYTVQPRPHIESVGCRVDAARTGSCDHGATPGRVVDIGPELRILATENLDARALRGVRIRPALPRMQVGFVEGGSRLLQITGEWAADQVYEVRMPPMSTVTGERLADFGPLAVRSRGHRPQIEAPEGRLAFERDDPGVLRLRGIATGKGALMQRVVPCCDASSDAAALQAALDPSTFVTFRPDTHVPLLQLIPDARANRWGEGKYAWAKTQGEGPAMAVVGFRPGEHEATGTRALFAQRTNLAATVRMTREGALVWVSRLHDATPVQGAHVALADDEGRVLGTVTTDADGGAWIATDEDRTELRQAVLVRHSGDRAVVVLERGAVVGPAHMNVAVARAETDDELPLVSVFTDRGAYRPGSELHVRLGVHEREGHGAVAEMPLIVRVQSPGAVVPDLEAAVTTNRWGSASASFTLPGSMSFGGKEVVVVRPRASADEENGDDESEEGGEGESVAEVRLASASIRVAQFRDPSFRVDVAMPQRVIAGEPLTARVDARYLFGAPLANGELHHSLIREHAASHAPRWRELTFGPAGHHVDGRTLVSENGRLDANGRVTLDLSGRLEATVRHQLVFEAEARDRSGQSTAAHRTVTVHPAAFEVGLERGPEWVAHCTGDDCEGLRAAVVVVDPDDQPVAGRTVDVAFYREGWHDWWQWSSGAYQARQQHRRERVHQCTLQSAGETLASCEHVPERAGTYVIEATVVDDEGRRALASRRLYVAGPDEAPDRDPAGTRIALTPKRPRYRVGETAELAIESPWPEAEVLVSVERDGVIHRSRERVGSGGHVVRVPVTEAMVPNAFVSVALVRPRLGPPGERMDLLGPDLRFGMASIQARPEESGIDVSVDAPESANPGDEITVRVHADRDSEVVLWAVDEGILRLTRWWQTPNPTEALYPSEGAAFAWEDIRRVLASRVAPPEERAGGDGGGSAERALRPTEPVSIATPLWAPHLETDGEGNAQATFTVPDRDTEYRILAVAIDAHGASGSATTQLVAKRAVVAREALPTFATEGDQFEAAFFLTNTSDEGHSVLLRTTIGDETSEERIYLHPGRERRVVRRVAVADRTRELPVFLEARTREGTQRVGRTLPIAPAARWTRRHAFGAIGGTSETRAPIGLRFPEGAVGRARLVVAAHPFLGARLIDEGLGGWNDLEHRAARAIVAISQLELQEGVDLDLDAEELRARAQLAIDALLEHQNYQGAFGRYDANGWSTPVEGTMAVHALVLATDAGLRVPESARTQALDWLEDMSRRAAFGSAYGVSTNDAEAYALHVLRDGGRELPEMVDGAFERRDGLGYAGRGHLALAMDDDDDRRETLVIEAAELAQAEERDPTLPYAVASAPTSAWERGALVEAASRTRVGHRHASPLASELLSPTAHCQAAESCAPVPPWASPIERIAAARALVAYASLFRRTNGGVALPTLDGEALGAREVGSTALASYEVPVERLAAASELAFTGGGEGPTFYAIEAEWTEPVGFEERTARGRGVSLHRRYERGDGRELTSGDAVQLGDTIRVRLFLHTELSAPANVRLADPLGAGFTAVDSAFDTAPSQALRALLGMGPADEVMDPRGRHAARTANAIVHRELEQNVALTYFEGLPIGLQEVTYAIRATTPGEFRIPPAQVDSARDDEFGGHSSLFTLRVVGGEDE